MTFHGEQAIFVGEAAIRVQDLKRSTKFYKEILGFNVLAETERSVCFTADGKKPLLTIEQPDGIKPKEQNTTGLYHFALLLPERAHLAALVKHFADNGVRFGSSDHLVSEALYLNDPDGNGIEVYTDRSSSKWSWENGNVLMAVDPLDFEALLEDRKGEWNGLPEETVMGHIHLHVSELQKTEEFYVKGLGFDVVSRFGNQALFLSVENYHHHIGLNTWNGVGAPKPQKNTAGLSWFSLVFPTEEKRNEIISQIKLFGGEVSEDNNGFTTEDPSGNKIKLKIYPENG
ncbi:VOC family protein [Jeotgalibacillus sp. S-D1]|uniref:VOC family protein n=1 Tax=Jeotgalibacillus sp. S-D1 TaxID=2552189 RepID=UPI00105AAC27|nr:VOC family protein [Jeotgalibacillus sp. S-D1]TDL30910.1 VOC family protein [Jeotgalibacillus sp. S-D1]